MSSRGGVRVAAEWTRTATASALRVSGTEAEGESLRKGARVGRRRAMSQVGGLCVAGRAEGGLITSADRLNRSAEAGVLHHADKEPPQYVR